MNYRLILFGCIMMILCGSPAGKIMAQTAPDTALTLSAAAQNGQTAVSARTVADTAQIDQTEDSTQIATDSAQIDRTGYINRTGIDLLAGNNVNTIRMQISHSYQVTRLFSAGIGTGYTFYRDPINLVPVFFDLVWQTRDDDVTPFFQLRFGYSFSVFHNRHFETDRHSGGLLLNPGFGLQVRRENLQGMYFIAGFNLDNAILEQDDAGNRVIKDTISWRRVSLGFGLIFP